MIQDIFTDTYSYLYRIIVFIASATKRDTIAMFLNKRNNIGNFKVLIQGLISILTQVLSHANLM